MCFIICELCLKNMFKRSSVEIHVERGSGGRSWVGTPFSWCQLRVIESWQEAAADMCF